MNPSYLIIVAFAVMSLCAGAQVRVTGNDSTTMNTTLSEVVVQGNQRGNYLSRNAVEKREMITVTGLKKMACCTLKSLNVTAQPQPTESCQSDKPCCNAPGGCKSQSDQPAATPSCCKTE